MSNRLKDEKSPYLLQHAENPVDWYPWCREAFRRAESEDKPVFLSIGYSTCHWCHVMERECFENEEIADILNKYFVSVKVDREERPDIDSVYMSVCQTLTGSGGWPMSIFMTPLQKPFFAGTYFPPKPDRGMMGFEELLLAIAHKWQQDKEGLIRSADEILSRIIDVPQEEVSDDIDKELPEKAAKLLFESFDPVNGGFGEAPKFPMPFNLIFLTLYSKYSVTKGHMHTFSCNEEGGCSLDYEESVFRQVEITLEKMRRGGIFDHIGYGFSRYATDERFLIPHFEKMLYDNALLIIAYVTAYEVSKEDMFLDTAKKTAEYILREMTGPDGEFYSAQDADSEGEEGKYYVYSYGEVCKVLGGERGKRFCEYFGITKKGNFEGRNIPNLLNGRCIRDNFTEEKRILFEYRVLRTKLHVDDKVLTMWNSLMISALSGLYKATGKELYMLAAKRAQEFIEKHLFEDGVLYVSCRGERGMVKGFLDDYACYGAALIDLYEVSSCGEYLKRAKQICDEAERQFSDERNGGYFLCGSQNSRLITKPKEVYDNALPSGNSVMAYCLVKLSQITGEDIYKERAKKQLAYMSGEAKHYPAGCCMFLIALLLYLHPPKRYSASRAIMQGQSDRL